MPTPFSRKTSEPAKVALAEVIPQPAQRSDFLQIEDMRGGMYLCVDFTEITAWRQELSSRGAEEALGLVVYLANGEAVTLLQVSFAYFTAVLREHYGITFDSYFIANDVDTLYLRKSHILGFSSRQGHTLHVRGQHKFGGLRVTVADLSILPAMVRRQPEPTVVPIAPPAPQRVAPEYDPEAAYSPNALVQYDNSLYRRATRGPNLGNPLENVADWMFVRALVGPEPVRPAAAEAKSRRTSDYPVFDPEADYSRGDIVRHAGRLYRKLTRTSRGGVPGELPGWDEIR